MLSSFGGARRRHGVVRRPPNEVRVRLTVLGCCGGSVRGRNPTSFLIDDRIAVDCGAVTAALDPREQERVEHILLTHAHLDHLANLPFLLDNRFERQVRPIHLHAPEATLEVLRSDLFNNRLWPDFTALRNKKAVSVELHAVADGSAFDCGSYRVTTTAMVHPVPCCGYLVDDGTTSVFIAGDTGSAEGVRDACAGVANLAAIVIEVSWPNRMDELARISGHLTPAMLDAAWPLHPTARIMVTHIKPFVHDEVVAELKVLGHPALTILQDGDVFEL
jgi:ribonuclease BN (tRNA processing enzyme)